MVGRLFGDVLKRNPSLLDWVGRFSGALLVVGILGFLVGRVVRRRMVIKKLVASRLEPEELKRQLDAGEEVFIVDLRHPLELLQILSHCPARSISRPRRWPGAIEDPPRPRHRAFLLLPQRGYRRQNRHDPAQAGHRAHPPLARRL